MKISAPLLRWYDRHQRDLPWRRSNDPYAIWVSEAMLQQTQVATVIPYYHRFLENFPTVADLAAAPEQAVLKAWEGLGYYSRARNLRRAAQLVVSQWGSRLPDSLDDLKSLPGIGPYMAAAVASIAYGRRAAVLDGNVERVLTRLHEIAGPARDRAVNKRLWQLADAQLSARRPGDHNQAMMELGATVCTPRKPDCPACPLLALCGAGQAGDPERYPVKLKKPPPPHHDIAVGVVRHQNRLLVVRRPSPGLLGGLWEFPGGRCKDGEAVVKGVTRQLAERFGMTVTPGAGLAPVAHAFTHRKVTLYPIHCQVSEDRVTPCFHTEHRWLELAALSDLPLPRAHQKIVQALMAAQG